MVRVLRLCQMTVQHLFCVQGTKRSMEVHHADERGSGFAPPRPRDRHAASCPPLVAAWSATDFCRLQGAVSASRLGVGGPVTVDRDGVITIAECGTPISKEEPRPPRRHCHLGVERTHAPMRIHAARRGIGATAAEVGIQGYGRGFQGCCRCTSERAE